MSKSEIAAPLSVANRLENEQRFTLTTSTSADGDCCMIHQIIYGAMKIGSIRYHSHSAICSPWVGRLSGFVVVCVVVGDKLMGSMNNWEAHLVNAYRAAFIYDEEMSDETTRGTKPHQKASEQGFWILTRNFSRILEQSITMQRNQGKLNPWLCLGAGGNISFLMLNQSSGVSIRLAHITVLCFLHFFRLNIKKSFTFVLGIFFRSLLPPPSRQHRWNLYAGFAHVIIRFFSENNIKIMISYGLESRGGRKDDEKRRGHVLFSSFESCLPNARTAAQRALIFESFFFFFVISILSLPRRLPSEQKRSTWWSELDTRGGASGWDKAITRAVDLIVCTLRLFSLRLPGKPRAVLQCVHSPPSRPLRKGKSR